MKSKIIFTLLCSFLSTTSTRANGSFLASTTAQKIVTLAVGGAAAYGGYKIAKFSYYWIKEYIENKIINKATQSIMIILTPQAALKTLPQEKQKAILHKKARFVCMRQRIVGQLQTYINNSKDTLSPAHYKELESINKKARLVFKAVDFFRNENVYEQEYKIANSVETIIENEILKSLIADAKPNSECTAKELAQKKQRQERRSKIIAKLTPRIEKAILKHITDSTLFFNLLLG